MPQITKQTNRQPPNNHRAAGSVLDRIRPIGFDRDDGVKILLYGRSGTGKTTLWGTFPKPILTLVCSGSNNPGETRSIDTPENRKVIDQVVVQDSQEVRAVVEYVAGGSKYKTVVLDHASGLQDLVLKEILGLSELPAQKGWGLASQNQYGQCTLQCKELLRVLLGLGEHVVIVAQEREFNNDAGDSELIQPTVGAGLTPSLTGWLNTAVDYICQTFIRQKEEVKKVTVGDKVLNQIVKTKQVEFCLRTAPDPVYHSKFRLPKGSILPPAIVDPSYDKIAALIRGK